MRMTEITSPTIVPTERPSNSQGEWNDTQFIDSTLKTQSYIDFQNENPNVYWVCGGRFLIGPSAWIAVFGTSSLVLVPSICVAVFILPGLHLWVSFVTAFGFSLTMFFLFATAFRDPGFIPRSDPSEIPENLPATGSQMNGWKWCHTCKIWRPPRSKHCSTTDACVRMFDHHCPWTGNTIGERNYNTFYGFVTMVLIYGIFVFIIFGLGSGPVLQQRKSSNGTFLIVVMSIAGIATLAVILLCCRLTMNLSRGVTTAEGERQRFEHENKIGFFANLKFFCVPKPTQITYD